MVSSHHHAVSGPVPGAGILPLSWCVQIDQHYNRSLPVVVVDNDLPFGGL